jgi:hypothetical protein
MARLSAVELVGGNSSVHGAPLSVEPEAVVELVDGLEVIVE